MPCYHPIKGFICQDGKFREWNKVISREEGRPQTIPCCQCIGCRLERSRQWAVRCMHEAQFHVHNSFITLTYDNNYIPMYESLHYPDFQDFMKRFKSKVRRKYGRIAANRIRFYMCGEYGDKLGRPHYHACIFGFDFADKTLWQVTDSGSKLYRSKFLEELWQFGFSSVGDVNFQSAAYVARYIMKKITGDAAYYHYQTLTESGQIIHKVPEFNHMSLKPGIGSRWLQEFYSDVFPHDYVVVNGKQCKPPRYYVDKFAEMDPETHQEIMISRLEFQKTLLLENTPERLYAKEKVAEERLSRLKRNLNN